MEQLTWPCIIAGMLSSFAFVPYIISIVNRKTRPHLMSWVLWTLLGIILAASYRAAGAPLPTLVVPTVFVVGPLVIAILSIKYGEYGLNLFDMLCLVAGLCGMVFWLATSHPEAALYLTIIVDFIAALPTLKKIMIDPRSESLTSWVLFSIGNAVNLLTLPFGYLSLAIVSYPLYLFLFPCLMSTLLLKRYIK